MSTTSIQRLRIVLHGAVQGVGFRPFMYRLASDLGLKGWVSNDTGGVLIEVEGGRNTLEVFQERLKQERPPGSFIESSEALWLDATGFTDFQIRPSDNSGEKTVLIMPDLATCQECRQEILDRQNRRYFYPFTNCTHCGPRYSIITALPYDREHTTMSGFQMCPQCRSEYEDPRNRRFHAQPNACPACGPQVELWDNSGRPMEWPAEHESLVEALPREANSRPSYLILSRLAQALAVGQIAAVKGLGGFHLMVDARNDQAVAKLRERKHREEKPLAVMFPSLAAASADCEISPLESAVLQSPESPIVLLRKRTNTGLSPLVAPGNPYVGALLPYTPLHDLLLSLTGFPVVATSGNLSDEPICTDEREAVSRLGQIADLFLVHNRPIARHVDDSIVRIIAGREMVLRRARGFAPLPVFLPKRVCRITEPVLGVGAHLKNTIALGTAKKVFISQHIGDLETAAANQAFQKVIADLQQLYAAPAMVVAADLHPDYLSSKYAEKLQSNPATGQKVVKVQHHLAHVLGCMAENDVPFPVLGVSWDGTGFGTDQTVWGGEFFKITESGWERFAHLRTFKLPGGEKAIREPRRSALGLLHEMGVLDRENALLLGAGTASSLFPHPTLFNWSPEELANLHRMFQRNLNSPVTSSAGRLFDGVAALLGLRLISHYEGQAAMELEFAATQASESLNSGRPTSQVSTYAPKQNPASHASVPSDYSHMAGEPTWKSATQQAGKPALQLLPDALATYPFQLSQGENKELVVDWGPAVEAVLRGRSAGDSVADLALRFHLTLSEMSASVAERCAIENVVLSGGCFQNRLLLEMTARTLRARGFHVYWPQRVPPNDGGISLGQVVAAHLGFV